MNRSQVQSSRPDVDVAPQHDAGADGASSSEPWEGRTVLLRYVGWLVFVSTGAISALVIATDLNPPFAEALVFVAAVGSGLWTIADQVLTRFVKVPENLRRWAFFVTLILLVVFVGLAALAWFMHSEVERLTSEGVWSGSLEVPANARAEFQLELDAPAYIVLEVDEEGTDACLGATAEVAAQAGDAVSVDVSKKGLLRRPFGARGQNRWELGTMLVRGSWSVAVTNDCEREGRFRARYQVPLGSAPELPISSSESGILSSGVPGVHVWRADEASEFEVSLEGLEPDDLPITLELYSTARRLWSAVPEDGRIRRAFRPGEGAEFVLVVRALSDDEGAEPEGAYVLAVQPASAAGATPVGDVVTELATNAEVPATTGLPLLYELPESAAHEALLAVGLVPESIRVCSSSVAAGHVRQAFLQTDDAEQVVADRDMSARLSLPVGSVVRLKVSTGEPCT